MSTTTTNLELVKPAGNERVDVDVINGNYDKIDEFAGLAITDANYVHTDNNYTTTEKNKLSAIQPNATETSFTQTLISGTAVGTITINGTDYVIYAPSSSGGASALNDLSDVTLASPSNGQVLKYNATSGKWENADESGGGGGFDPNGDSYRIISSKDGNDTVLSLEYYEDGSQSSVEMKMCSAGSSFTQDFHNLHLVSNGTTVSVSSKIDSIRFNDDIFNENDEIFSVTIGSASATYSDIEEGTYTPGGGSTVSWTQIQGSGTKIAEIEIDGATQNVFVPTIPNIPTKTSDLTNDSNFVADASYVHTDNNYTSTEKTKLSGLVEVEANPSGTASTDLTKIGIGGTNYNIPSGGSGSSTFAGLTDVDIDNITLANRQVPVWNSTTEKWENAFISSGPTEFIETLDVGGQWVTHTYDLTDAYMVKIECDGDSYFIAPNDIAVYSLYTTLFTKDNVNFNIARSADYQTLYVSFSVPTSLTADVYAMTRGSGGTTVIANPTGTPTDELNSIQIGNDIYEIVGGGGGHTILNDNGTPLAQESNLQFRGAYSHDDSTNGKTVVEVSRSMTKAEYDQLTEAEKTGIINVTDEEELPWKDITGVLHAGETEIILSDDAITVNSTFEAFTDPIEVSHTDMVLVNEPTLINDILTGEDNTKVTASSYDTAEVVPWKAFDGIKGVSSGTYSSPYHAWLAGNADVPCWLQYHFDGAKYIDEVKVYVYCNNGTYTGSAKIQGSNDGTTWTDISSAVSISAPYNVEVELDFECDSNRYSYVRLYSDTAFTIYGGASIFVGEMEIYGRSSAKGVKVIFPAQAENLNVKVRIS